MIGISYHAGGMKDLPLQEVISILSEVGYDAIEMMLRTRSTYPLWQDNRYPPQRGQNDDN